MGMEAGNSGKLRRHGRVGTLLSGKLRRHGRNCDGTACMPSSIPIPVPPAHPARRTFCAGRNGCGRAPDASRTRPTRWNVNKRTRPQPFLPKQRGAGLVAHDTRHRLTRRWRCTPPYRVFTISWMARTVFNWCGWCSVCMYVCMYETHVAAGLKTPTADMCRLTPSARRRNCEPTPKKENPLPPEKRKSPDRPARLRAVPSLGRGRREERWRRATERTPWGSRDQCPRPHRHGTEMGDLLNR
eukprot:gene14602-biopygen12648